MPGTALDRTDVRILEALRSKRPALLQGLLAYVSVKLKKRGKMPMEDFAARVQGWAEVRRAMR